MMAIEVIGVLIYADRIALTAFFRFTVNSKPNKNSMIKHQTTAPSALGHAMKLQILATLLLALTINVFADSPNTITLFDNRADGSKISYYLFEESKEHQSDALLLVLQGSDCNSVLQMKSIFSDFKNVWPEADLLLIEKYGIDRGLPYSVNADRKDCPKTYLKKDGPNQRIKDIEIVLNTINKGRTYKKHIVIGVSEGAVIANLLATNNRDIDATISLNGGSRWFIDDVLHNINSEYANEQEAKESVEGFRGFSQHILK